MMPLFHEFLFLLFSHLMLLANGYQGECPGSFSCGYLGNISFPFTTTERQDCGLLPIPNCDGDPMKPKMIKYQNKGKWFEFEVQGVTPLDFHSGSTTCSCVFRDSNLYKLLETKSCKAFRHNYTLPPTPHFVSFRMELYTTLFMCNRTPHVSTSTHIHNYTKCPHYDLYYQPHIYADNASRSDFSACTNVLLPIKDLADAKDPFTFITADTLTEVKITEECAYCHFNQSGQCQIDSKGRFYCANANGTLKQTPWKQKQHKCTALI